MKRILISLFILFAIVATPVLQTGCQNTPATQSKTVQTLLTIGTTAKTAMDASTQLLKQGAISVDQWRQIANFFDTKWQPAFALAVSAAHSDLSSLASPDLIALAAQFTAFIAQVTAK